MALLKKCISLRNILIPCAKHTIVYPDRRNIARWVSPTLRELKRRRDRIGPEPERPRSSYLDWNYQAEVYAFGQRVNEHFDPETLAVALTDKSYNLKKHPGTSLDNRELVRRGEDFLVTYLTEYLRGNLIRCPEDVRRAVLEHLTSEELLAHVATHIGLKDVVLCAEFPPSKRSLADSLKAVVAALMHSSTSARASSFVRDFVVTQLQGKNVFELWSCPDALARLTSELEADGRGAPEPRLCARSAINDLMATYRVGLYDQQRRLLGSGWGEDVDTATDVAARDALIRLYGTQLHMAQLPFATHTH